MSDDLINRLLAISGGKYGSTANLRDSVKEAANRIEKLTSGPGGIMEMKQTIADLEKYRDLVYFIANDYLELSYEKAQWQRDDWMKRCRKLIELDNKDG